MSTKIARTLARRMAGLAVVSCLAMGGTLWAQPKAAPSAEVSGEDAPADGAQVRKSLVKIFTTSREPDLTQPWTKQRAEESSGSGVVIDGNRIITNNHVIAYASRVLVQPDGSSDKLDAKVIAAAPGIDLAVIELTKNPEFFSTHPAIPISDDLPSVGQTVYAYGYPVGGDAVSITKGVISRIEHTGYNGFTSGLRIQIDAAINHGNSGGPAVVGGKLVGLSFSGIESADNVGYIIPVEEIRAFLEDIKDGTYEGRPQYFGEMQTVENEDLRIKLGLTPSQTGLMVTRADEQDAPLQTWDVLAAIGEHDIDNTGMVTVRENLRLGWHYFVPKLARDGKVPVTIIREGKEMKLDLPVTPAPNRLFTPLDGAYPRYFIIGPMCFSTTAADHAGRYGNFLLDRGSPLASRRSDKPKFPGEEIVIGPVRLFSHPIMKGYETPPFPALKSVNGIEVKNLKHLVEIIRDSTDKHLIFVWNDRAAETLVFDRAALIKSTDDVLEDGGIRNQMSDDLKPVWNAKN